MQTSTIHFEIGSSPVTGKGLGVSSDQLESALTDSVRRIVFDEEGAESIEELITSIPDTQFKKEKIRRILESPRKPENWRVGEAMAESFLVENKGCLFPWPVSRDERKARSSLPGADLVGMVKEGEVWLFAFGEVKTSSDANVPPGVVYGLKGLRNQVADLRNSPNLKEHLIRYIAHRAKNSHWVEQFRGAASTYLQNRDQCQLHGILIRDVAPNEKDLEAVVDHLTDGCPDRTNIKLHALYIPASLIKKLGTTVFAAQTKFLANKEN